MKRTKQSYQQESELWFHDVLRAAGQPYCEKEVAHLVRFNKKHSANKLTVLN